MPPNVLNPHSFRIVISKHDNDFICFTYYRLSWQLISITFAVSMLRESTDLCVSKIIQHIHDQNCFIRPPGGGYSVRKLLGMCRGPLKIGPKKIEGKMVFWGQKEDFVRICTQKIVFVLVDEKKHPKKIEFGNQRVKKRGSKPRHKCITHHIGSTPPRD